MEMIDLVIFSTYNEHNHLSDEDDFIEEQMPLHLLPQRLMELAQRASDDPGGQELVISFPDGDPHNMHVEIYNGYRE